MRWPGSQGLEFLSEANFFIAAKVNDMSDYIGKVIPENWSGKEFPIVSDAGLLYKKRLSKDKTHRHILQPVPGFYNGGKNGFIDGISEDINNDGELSPKEDINYNGVLDLNLNHPPSIINSLAISTDKRTWPQYWPGGSYIGDDRPYFGRPPRTLLAGQRIGRWNGEYKSAPIADQETLYWMDDHENDYANDYTVFRYWPKQKPDGTPDTTSYVGGGIAGAGIEVEARTYAWFHPLAEDLLVSVYRVRNYSDYVLNRVITGMRVDAQIGGEEYRWSNDADFIMADTRYTGEGGRRDFDIVYQWHKFPENFASYQKVGTFALAFLESPGIDYNEIDDDADRMIDESMSDGIDNDGDWEPFADIGLDNLQSGDDNYNGPDYDGTENNGIWDTEDVNLNGALDAGEDGNKNNNLDMEPVNDDRGTDGIGPDENGWTGPDKDGSECNGLMNLGEPDFDLTDLDEADQAGLKHVFVGAEIFEELLNPRLFWDNYLENEDQDVEQTDEDIAIVFGARNVKLEKGIWKRFTIALIMGENKDDAIRNKAIMQDIYDRNYRFLTPPIQPTLISNVSDRSVQLYWNSSAENSKDELLGKDFNGYRLYKSTDPKFLDIKTISDAFGNALLFKPLAIFDKVDSLTGFHPIPFPETGVHYDMGKDSGLRHSYRDTWVDNGRTYFYAVTAIDAGNDWDFFERGLVTKKYPGGVMPSESPFNITVNTLGEVVYRSRSTAVCVPTEPAAGFSEPYVDTINMEHVCGTARIKENWKIAVFNKHQVNSDFEYEITFADDGWLDKITPDFQGGLMSGIRCKNLTTGNVLFDMNYPTAPEFLTEGYPLLEQRVLEGLNFGFDWDLLSGKKEKGIKIIKTNSQGRRTNEWKHWLTNSKTNLHVGGIDLPESDKSFPLPIDVEIRVEDFFGIDTSVATSMDQETYPLNFTTWNITDPNDHKKMDVQVAYDNIGTNGDLPHEMYGQIWDSTRVTIMFPGYEENIYWASWQLYFFKNKFDSQNPVIPPEPGDIYRFQTYRYPSRLDTFRFKVKAGEWSQDLASKRMKDIYVVPDPYVVSSSFESVYELADFGQRRIDFVNLPPKCTIKIFTASGKLVKTLEHNAPEDFGRHSWDLTTEDGPEVSYGMYFFVVDAKGIGIKRGRFAIIK